MDPNRLCSDFDPDPGSSVHSDLDPGSHVHSTPKPNRIEIISDPNPDPTEILEFS